MVANRTIVERFHLIHCGHRYLVFTINGVGNTLTSTSTTYRGLHPIILKSLHLSVLTQIQNDERATRREVELRRPQLQVKVRIHQTDTERHKVGGDETGETVLVEVGGIVVKAYLIIVKSDQATTLVSTPTTLLFTIINVVHH
ncbi:hypothetical protein C4D60_Mb08t12900 [Musa balbisiana]|uniref:Uncharacterized protein n=1 Tax=Musa balbisiana TaxID=52838 RepID=A0A4S8K3E0_MUSBA|nr:hypothetical protein C4D60_Mb08t12900 [Musa balbisiana]